MKKRISEILTMVISLLFFMILSTMIMNFIFHDLQISAFLTIGLIVAVAYLNYQSGKKDQANFLNQCGLQYNAILTYIVACMQTSSWAPGITAPADIASIATPYFPVYATRCFTTTLKMVPTNRAPLTSSQLTQIRQILNTDFQTAIQNGYIQCRNIKVGFPINNNNEVHVVIEVFV